MWSGNRTSKTQEAKPRLYRPCDPTQLDITTCIWTMNYRQISRTVSSKETCKKRRMAVSEHIGGACESEEAMNKLCNTYLIRLGYRDYGAYRSLKLAVDLKVVQYHCK
ncbi:uncharacterized protein LOC124178167 [Neodiprion fabricii]|uniref:uncharacterized protein LOC124178167 n=1 Tax=Neodiprion fabricii TaxID=2872261 RepID=UPI001ED97E19|nr:uncharacterized protein LOC124178167 [Neodiprion fabricii]